MPEERTSYYKPITLESVDTAVYRWFDRIVDAHVVSPTRDRYKVPVLLATKERWITAKDSKGIRDDKGRIILPVISIRRTGFDPVNSSTALATNVPRLAVSKKVSQKTNLIRNNLKERPISQRNLNESVVYEVTSIPFPTNGTVTYELLIQAQYQLQMNSVIEKIMSQLEYYETPQFIIPLDSERNEGTGNKRTQELEDTSEAPYEKRALMDSYYFVGFFEPGMNNGSNFEEFTDQERIVKYTTTFRVPAYLHLEPEGKAPAVKVQRTAFHLSLGSEKCHFVDDPYELELIFSNGKVEEK